MRTKSVRIVLFIFFIACISRSTELAAKVITVRQDGLGKYTTIGDAIDSSKEGDKIEVWPGTYLETFREVFHSLELVSTQGADVTIIDGQGINRGFKFTYPAWVEVSGFTFQNGRADSANGGALTLIGPDGFVRDCVFQNGYGEWSSGAIYFCRNNDMTVENCVFRNNTSPTIGGACSVTVDGSVMFRNCTFSGNSAGTWGGALWVAQNAGAVVEGCLFTGNSTYVGSCMYFYRASGNIIGNTFHGNVGTVGGRGAVYLHISPSVSFHRNIVSGEINGYGLTLHGQTSSHTCNIYFDNDEGAIHLFNLGIGQLDPTESTLDPVYCDPDAGDLTVSTLGPAAPDNNVCGVLVGAFATACTIEPPPDPSTTGVGGPGVPVTTVGQNIPNPFNPVTAIPYSVAAGGGHVTLSIFDIHGRLVRRLVDELQAQGQKTVRWDGRNNAGASVSSGVYLYRLRAPGFDRTRRLIVIR